MADRPFEAIVEAHHAEIHGYLRRVVSRVTEADHLVQETFLRAFRAYRSLPADADVRVWLFGIATHLCRTHGRSVRPRRAVMEGASETRSAADGDRPAGVTRLHEARSRLEDIIGGLPITPRLAVTMRKLHDLDYDAIGASLDCSAKTAKSHVLQALRQIRRGLDGARPNFTEKALANLTPAAVTIDGWNRLNIACRVSARPIGRCPSGRAPARRPEQEAST